MGDALVLPRFEFEFITEFTLLGGRENNLMTARG